MSNSPIPVAGTFAMATWLAPEPKTGTIFPLAVYPSAGGGVATSSEMFNAGWHGVRLSIITTVIGGAGNVVVKVQGKDQATGAFSDIPGAVTAAITTNTTTTLTIYPGLAETAGVDIGDPLPLSWRVVATVTGNDVTFSISGVYLD